MTIPANDPKSFVDKNGKGECTNMTHTGGIANTFTSSGGLDAVDRTSSARTAVVRTSAKSEAAVQNTPGTTKLSGLGSILAASVPDLSDVRTDKVATLKSAIDSGTYKVAASAVADKLIDGLLG